MTVNGFIQIVLFFGILLACVKPLGTYLLAVYQGQLNLRFSFIDRFEERVLRLCRIERAAMDWKNYLVAFLIFNLLGIFLIYLIQRLQFYLPLNQQQFAGVDPLLAFNTAISFTSNTSWQAYRGESTLSYFTQMMGVNVQCFLSAASGMSVLIALLRGLSGLKTQELGNFWVDTIRGTFYILLPLSFVLALALCSQGVIQNLKPYEKIHVYEQTAQTQLLPMGPVASQVAIRQLGSDGGGFFATTAAHPFENPTPLSNFLELLALILIPAALCYTFGLMVNDKRQGFGVLAAMFILFLPALLLGLFAEQHSLPGFTQLGVAEWGNYEGKEVRLGVLNSVLWATTTSATSNGAVNAMLDSFTPLGGLVPLWLMHLNEVVFGSVGAGLYNMLMMVIITVFVAGLMVGRTPEYLGKKIEPFEMKMASVVVLVMPVAVLLFTALACVLEVGKSAIGNPGAHGFTEILYAFTSLTNTNGSAFAGLDANRPFYNILGGIAMLIGRYWVAIPVLAIAGSLAKKHQIPTSSGTLPTHTPLFIFLLVCITWLLGALSFLPALALGPLVEHLQIWGPHV